jgi:hypothetical protein
MVNLSLIKNGVGFGLKGFGIFWAIGDRFLCDTLCKNGACTIGNQGSCGMIFLFVAIIFVVCGYVIVKMPKRKRKKIKKLFTPKLGT